MFTPNQQIILENVMRHILLSEEEKQFFVSLLREKKVRKKQFILEAGNISDDTIFVCSGCLRGFSADKNGFEHILAFAPPNWWIADLYSNIMHQPASLYIEAIEETQVILLSSQDKEHLYLKVPAFERFFRIIAEKSLAAHQQRLLDSLSLNAEERYARFCQRYPMLIDHLPQKYIAAYIGVTPEFFSTMRTRLLRAK